MSDNKNSDGFTPFDSDDEYSKEYEFESEQDKTESLVDVRGESELAKQKKLQKKGQKAIVFILASLASVVLVAMGYYLYARGTFSDEVEQPQSNVDFAKPEERDFGQAFMQDEIGEYDPYAAAKENVDDGNLSPIEPIEDNSTAGLVGRSSPEPTFSEPPQIEPPQIEPPQIQPPPAAPVEKELTPEELKAQRIYKDSFSLGSSGGALSSGTQSKPSGNTEGSNSNSGTSLSNSLSSAKIDSTSATQMGNRDLILTKGNMIDCVLNTKFNSTVVGMMTCTTTRNIYSSSGRVILIDRGSKIVGEYQGGIKFGQSRVFVLWKRIETPKGVIINIDSPASGSLGQSGVTGRLDNKFWTRFGGAMMVSLIEDASSAVTQAASEKAFGVDLDVEDTTQTGKEFAQEYINQLVNIKPSLIKHQGDRLNVFVARDVYFDDVYDLQVVRP